MNKIAVITPAYNCAASVRQTIRSVASQLYLGDDVEVRHYVIDDASTDDTSSVVLSEFDRVDPTYKYTGRLARTDINKGPARVRNEALKMAKLEGCDTIAFLDADDLWYQHHLKVSLNLLYRYHMPTCSDPYLIFSDGSPATAYGIPVGQSPSYPNILNQNSIYISTVVMKTSQLVGDFDCELNGIEDWDYWLRVMESGVSFQRHEHETAQYVVSNNGMAGTTTNDKMNIFRSKHPLKQQE